MTNKKSTKRALLMSALSLLMCVSMLIGSTFAWFTDSVTSGNNIIKSGNLDIELEYWNGTTWADVKDATDILTNKLWEPGVTEVAYLRVANAGSLALKYQLGINILNEIAGKNQANETFKLSDYIMFGVVENVNGETDAYTKDDAGRTEAIAAVTGAKKISAGYTKADSMIAGKELYLALVVYMPTSVDNVANHNGTDVPQIDLGINVFATQMTAEEDSFNNQYDAAAPWTGIIPEAQPESLVLTLAGRNQDGGVITIKSAEAFVYLNKLVADFNAKANEIAGYDHYYYHWDWEIELEADIDLSNIPVNTINLAYFDTFNGNGHTISNVVMKDGQTSLFDEGTVENLNIENIVVNAPSSNTVGAVLRNKGSLNNVHVVNATITGGKYVGGLAGKGASFTNCSVKDSTVTGSDKTVGGLVGYSIGDPGTASVTGNTVENVTVTGAYNVGGLLGQSQNETVENNTVKNVTVKSTTELPADASSNEVRTAKLAARSNFANTVIGTNTVENVTTINVVTVANTAELQAAINSGATEIALGAGEFTADLYVVPANRNLTITGQGAATKLNFKKGQVRLELFDSLTISNCTMGRMVDKSWGQLVYGSSTQSGGVYTLSNCVFNGEGTQGIFINQNVEATFNIENCTFNGDFGGEGAITIQNNDGVDITVNVTECAFNNIPATSHEIYMLYAYNGWTLNAEGVNAYWKTNP